MKSAIIEAAEYIESELNILSMRPSAKRRKLVKLAQRLRAEANRPAIPEDRLREVHHQEQFGLFCDFDEFEQIVRHVEHMLAAAAPTAPAVNESLTGEGEL